MGFTGTLDVAGLRAALQKYLHVRVAALGVGAYGSVQKALHRESGEVCGECHKTIHIWATP